MTRNAPLSLEGFDPDVIEAARDVARRAGVPVETWIASIVEPEAVGSRGAAPDVTRTAKPAAPRSEPSREGPAREEPTRMQPARMQPARKEPTGEAAADTTPVAPVTAPKAEGVAAETGFDPALSEMMRRLDALDRQVARETREIGPAAGASLAEPPAAESTPGATNAMALRLAEIERRMTEIGEQLASPRAIGRRGRPAVTEIRDAVSEIRQRQRELAGEAAPQTEGRRTGATGIAELQSETNRLRESIGGLASGRDVGALEQAMRALAVGVEKAQAPSDLAAIAAPIELLRVQVARLAEDVAENVHARVAADVERLAAKVDGALHNAPAGLADSDVHAGLYRELDEIRRLIGSLAGPERIQSLASGLQAISNQIAQLQDGMPGRGGGYAELRPILEEIRSGLRSGPDAGIGERIDEMGAKLDALRGSAPTGFDGRSDAILHRLDALAEQVERVHINPVGDLIGRLEDLGATLRRPVVPGEDIASIHAMLHDLAVKLDRIGTGEGPRDEGLDALEHQVLALAQRIDTRDADPALAGLERTMSDLLDQVSALRNEAPIEAAVERAARHAVAETMGATDPGEVGMLRASLADLRAHQVASEQRMQSTLTGVYTALERLVGRLGTGEGEAASAPARTLRETLAERANAVTPRGEALRAERHLAATARNTGPDLPLEPGAGRPGRERAVETGEAPLGADSDIKSSFIAAARRAAQAAQAEAAGQAESAGPADASDGSGEARAEGRLARLRGGIDRRRKPLLLGLAAIVLLLGAFQAVTARRSADPAATPVVDAQGPSLPGRDGATAAAPGQASDGKGSDGKGSDIKSSDTRNAEAKPASKPVTEPQTTQSLAENPATGSATATANAPRTDVPRIDVPRVPALAGLTGDLAAVPPALGKLRQATLDGDGAAAYDLAARAAEGRGLPRDVPLAARIFETLGTAGYAPAQYKLGSLHEKGVGIPRDLAQAKLWYGRAAERGNARAMHNLAVIHAENPAAGGKPDFATAGQWFKRAAEFGLRDSQYNLAVLYARGMGVPQDLEQSYLWFSAASAQGDADAAKKRDDVAAKLEPKALAAAKAQLAAFKPKVPEPAANEPPAPTVIENAMSLLGAPPPSPGTVAPARRI